jgi:branched-chain amino acid transport system substrate-binding protein
MRHGRWILAVIAAVAIGAVVTGCRGGGEDGRRGEVRELPKSSCPTPIVYRGDGDPTLLIASDLPLQNPQLPQVAQMGKAIEFVLEQHDFTAGDKRVAYQACDDSTAQAAAWDSARCSANANAYAANAAVIGIVGTYDSACAQLMLPILNGKGIAMVSPTNTYVGLTQGGPVAPGEPAKYFPSGRRSYARVIAADNFQGPALATFAKNDLKLDKVFVADDGQRYGDGVADGFVSAASKLRLAIAGRRKWAPAAARYDGLAEAVKRSGADGVLIAGIVDNHGGQLLRDLRAALGARIAILAPDGFSPVTSVVDDAGRSAERMYVSIPGPPADRLTGRGKAFVDAFGATVGGPENVPADAVYAAQATEVMLGAIAVSDGSRVSVADKLFETDVDDGLMGTFAIDANGDTTAGAVSIVQVRNGAQAAVTVVTPDPDIVPKG